MKRKRLRSEIIDLVSGMKFLNESDAAEATGISRYYVHKSIATRQFCKGYAFALYSYGMDIAFMRSLYKEDKRKNCKKESN